MESVGENVEEVKEGDFVVPVFLPNCGECMDCESEKSNICCRFPTQVQPGMRDGTSRITDSKGKTVYNFLNVSSFSEYTVVDINNIVKIDSDIPPEKACLLSGGVSAGKIELLINFVGIYTETWCMCMPCFKENFGRFEV